jgi:hypothetical protein
VTRFELRPGEGTAHINRWAHAPEGRIALHPHAWAQGALTSLYGAELLAAEAGLVPFIQLENGQRGIATIGEARTRLDKAPPEVGRIYRALHAAVRQTHAKAAPARPEVPELGELLEGHPIEDALALSGLYGETDPELGVVPAVLIAIVVGVVAVAGIVATAWYMRDEKRIEVDGQNTRFIAAITALTDLAREQLRLTGKIDPALLGSIDKVTENVPESNGVSWPFIAGGAVLCAAGGGYAYHRYQQHDRRKR